MEPNQRLRVGEVEHCHKCKEVNILWMNTNAHVCAAEINLGKKRAICGVGQ